MDQITGLQSDVAQLRARLAEERQKLTRLESELPLARTGAEEAYRLLEKARERLRSHPLQSEIENLRQHLDDPVGEELDAKQVHAERCDALYAREVQADEESGWSSADAAWEQAKSTEEALYYQVRDLRVLVPQLETQLQRAEAALVEAKRSDRQNRLEAHRQACANRKPTKAERRKERRAKK